MKHIKSLPSLFNPEPLKNCNTPENYLKMVEKKKPKEHLQRHNNAQAIFELIKDEENLKDYDKNAFLYNFFRLVPEAEDTGALSQTDPNLCTDIFLEEAKERLVAYEKETFEVNMKAISYHVEQLTIVTGDGKPKDRKVIIKKTDDMKFKGGRDDNLLFNKYVESFLAIVNSTYIFIPLDRKIEAFAKLFNEVYTLHTRPATRSSMLAFIYELVYLITVYRDWVDISEALKIITVENNG